MVQGYWGHASLLAAAPQDWPELEPHCSGSQAACRETVAGLARMGRRRTYLALPCVLRVCREERGPKPAGHGASVPRHGRRPAQAGGSSSHTTRPQHLGCAAQWRSFLLLPLVCIEIDMVLQSQRRLWSILPATPSWRCQTPGHVTAGPGFAPHGGHPA